jgi:opacity protein-like surface antigen
MGKLKALLLGGALAFGAVNTAQAADMPLAPPLEPIAPEPVAFGGWYLRGDVGVGAVFKPDIRSTFDASVTVPNARFNERSLGDTVFVGGGVGYQLNNWIRFDATGEYRTAQAFNAVESYNAGYFDYPQNARRAFDTYTGQVQSTVALANVYLDVFHYNCLTAFLGGGIGGSFNRLSNLTDVGVGGLNTGFGYAPERSSVSLAYQGTVGLSYDINPNLKLELAYRYLDMGDVRSGAIDCRNTGTCPREVQKISLASQDVKLGMRWLFSDIAPAPYYPPPPAPPLVRKY